MMMMMINKKLPIITQNQEEKNIKEDQKNKRKISVHVRHLLILKLYFFISAVGVLFYLQLYLYPYSLYYNHV